MAAPRTIRLAPDDNVIVAVNSVEAGTTISGVVAKERIPRGHKMAVAAIGEGEPVKKFGQIIGFATKAIEPGRHVHVHNVGLHDFARDYHFAEAAKNDEILPPELRATFEGYVRPSGKVGTRNFVAVISSVNCSATVARHMARALIARRACRSSRSRRRRRLRARHRLRPGDSPASRSRLRRPHQWGYATHPNIAGVLMVGLGCEVFEIARMKDAITGWSRAITSRP